MMPALWCTEMRTLDAARARMASRRRGQRAAGADQEDRERDRQRRSAACAAGGGRGCAGRGAGTSRDRPSESAVVHQDALVEPDDRRRPSARRAGRASPSRSSCSNSRFSSRSRREDVLGALRVEVAGGLVGDDEIGVGDDGARDRDALLLAAGELLRAVMRAIGRPTARSATSARSRRSARRSDVSSSGSSTFSTAVSTGIRL